MHSESPSPVQLAFRPESLRDRWRFAVPGRALLWRLVREIVTLPAALTPAERDRAQKRASAALLRHLRVQLEITGTEHVGGGPFLVLALHEGIVDVLALAQLPLPLRFVARDEIFTWPGIGPAITRLGQISIRPESGAAGYRQMLRRARDVVGAGESLLVFPQGTVLGLETDFQRGAFLLARQLDLPLLPAVLTGAHRVWEHPFTPCLRYGQRVGLRVLPPVGREEVRATLPETLRVQVRRAMKRAALDPDLPPPRRYVPERDGFWDGFRFDIDPDFPELRSAVERHRQSLTGDTP